MEVSDKNEQKTNGHTKDPNDFTKDPNDFTKEITPSPKMLEHITAIDLCNKGLLNIEDNVKFPPNLVDLNLSRNKLSVLPAVVQKLENLKTLDLSYNTLKYFDEAPDFCHSIEALNLSHNSLLGPPNWVWTKSPKKLSKLDLSFNTNLTNAFEDGYFEELLQYETPVVHLIINNCSLRHHLKLLNTFNNARTIVLGSEALSNISINRIIDLPSKGLEKCCDVQSLNLINTHVYNIMNNIDQFINLLELDLSQNYITGLPPAFCNLQNLKTCILSNNSILYLPDNLGELKNLVILRLDSNELCLLPDSIVELTRLECLDIYNNCLYELPEELNWVTELDLAQNYFDEPGDADYIKNKEKLRFSTPGRFDGRKIESVRPDSEHSGGCTDDEEYSLENFSPEPQRYDPPSSPEDWDSDEYWVPTFGGHCPQPPHMQWLDFIKRKMAEGNFCPMDAHIVPITEKVKYEKFCKPKVEHEVEGQFDDFSDDNS